MAAQHSCAVRRRSQAACGALPEGCGMLPEASGLLGVAAVEAAPGEGGAVVQ